MKKVKEVIKDSVKNPIDMGFNTLMQSGDIARNIFGIKKNPNRQKAVGLSPGTLIYTGERKSEKPSINILDYTDKNIIEKKSSNLDEIKKFKNKKSTTWVDVIGIHDIEIIKNIGESFDFHPLIMEDIVNVWQRPKFEHYGEYFFLVAKMLSYNKENKFLNIEQVSFILGKDIIFSFQERKGDVFEPVRERIRNSRWRERKLGADYLLYALVDAIVDNYFLVLEEISDEIELLEEKILKDPDPKVIAEVHRLKRYLIFLRKSIWPLREVISSLLREESSLVKKETSIYLRDVYDHTIQVIDTLESLKDVSSGIQDIYLSSLSNKMNEVMKVLTIFAAIFIPLTFLAGVYGMNFQYMPELQIRWAYPTVIGIMIATAISMVVYFKKKRWM